MDCEIRYHVSVTLEEPQINPSGVVIQDVAKFATFDNIPDLADSACVNKRMVHQQYEPALFGLGDELARLIGCFCHRLLDPKVLTRFEGSQTERKMRVYRGRNGNRVDAGIIEEILVFSGRADSG